MSAAAVRQTAAWAPQSGRHAARTIEGRRTSWSLARWAVSGHIVLLDVQSACPSADRWSHSHATDVTSRCYIITGRACDCSFIVDWPLTVFTFSGSPPHPPHGCQRSHWVRWLQWQPRRSCRSTVYTLAAPRLHAVWSRFSHFSDGMQNSSHPGT